MNKIWMVFASLFLGGCLGMPDKVTPVQNFQVEPYLGKWYEIARLDHSFERGLSQVSATYSRRDDGGLKVINRGYSDKKQQWSEAEGKAYFVDRQDEGYLKVSFFGPFYGSYVIFELDPDYQYAFISGPDLDYLWLLARTPQVSDELRQRFIRKAAAAGFNTDALIFVDQSDHAD